MKISSLTKLYQVQRQRALAFLKMDENAGTTTIEFVLWLPIFVLILGLIIDVCLLFLAQAIMYDVASDVARRTALGLYTTLADMVDLAETEASFRGTRPTATVTVTGSLVEVNITHMARDIDITGVLGLLVSDEINASVAQLEEGT